MVGRGELMRRLYLHGAGGSHVGCHWGFPPGPVAMWLWWFSQDGVFCLQMGLAGAGISVLGPRWCPAPVPVGPAGPGKGWWPSGASSPRWQHAVCGRVEMVLKKVCVCGVPTDGIALP